LIEAVLFDLDGTLLQCSQSLFLETYFGELEKVFARLGLDPGAAIKAMWAGTKDMMLNDGSESNARKFWRRFALETDLSPERQNAVEAACDAFYTNEFNLVKKVVEPGAAASRIVGALRQKGYCLVLATNPLFPLCAVESRLEWIGLSANDFCYITHYENSSFCKPSAGYFRRICETIGKAPASCLMAGNNPSEDMGAAALGMEVYLVTDHLENEAKADVSAFRRGTLADLERYLASFPAIGGE